MCGTGANLVDGSGGIDVARIVSAWNLLIWRRVLMKVKGLKHGDITGTFSRDLQRRIESIINAKSKRQKPYYLLITIKEGYGGPLAMGNNNKLLHGEDTGKKRARGATKVCDFSGLRVAHCVIQVLERQDVPTVPLLDSILLRVSNRTGKIRHVYALPPDIPIVDMGIGVDDGFVAQCAKGLPVVYGGRA